MQAQIPGYFSVSTKWNEMKRSLFSCLTPNSVPQISRDASTNRQTNGRTKIPKLSFLDSIAHKMFLDNNLLSLFIFNVQTQTFYRFITYIFPSYTSNKFYLRTNQSR